MIVKNKKEFLKTNSCNTCGGSGEIRTHREVSKCDCIKSWEKSYMLYCQIIKSGLNPSDLDYDIATYYGSKDIPNAVLSFISRFKREMHDVNIYFYGIINTQKSTIARFIARELISKGLNIRYVLMDSLIKTLRAVDDHTASIRDAAIEKVSEYKNADLLILDESFDSKRITLYKSSYQIPFLTTFLKDRIEVSKKSTIFVSNVNPRSIAEEGFTEALQSLILRESSKLEFKDCLEKKQAMKSTDFLDLFN